MIFGPDPLPIIVASCPISPLSPFPSLLSPLPLVWFVVVLSHHCILLHHLVMSPCILSLHIVSLSCLVIALHTILYLHHVLASHCTHFVWSIVALNLVGVTSPHTSLHHIAYHCCNESHLAITSCRIISHCRHIQTPPLQPATPNGCSISFPKCHHATTIPQ